MKTYLSWSGGKDSTASIILAHENNIHIDGIIMSEVMFDHSRNISGEEPLHITWIYDVAIPIIEKEFGYKVTIVKSKKDYVEEFYTPLSHSRIPERNGKLRGFPLGGKCVINRDLKLQPLTNFFKNIPNCEHILGIAADESIRLQRLKDNQRSLLAEYNINEDDTYDICKKYNLLSPIYSTSTRGGCWFCPNKSLGYLAKIKKNYPLLWTSLKELSKAENKCSNFFLYSKTFDEVDEKTDKMLEKENEKNKNV